MRDIKDYEGLYAATSCGRVWSYRAKKFLKSRKNRDGYLLVNLYKDSKMKTYVIHRLIAETYLPNQDNLPEVNHKDEDKSNNALPNLEWCTREYNINFGTGKERAAKSHQKKVICVETGIIYNSIIEAAKAVDISPSSISGCCKGKRKTAAGLHWRYYEDEE